MKRIIAVLLLLCCLCACLAGCGNQSLGFGTFTFEHIHFTDHIDSHCATIERWVDSETGIEVKTKEFGSLFLSEGSYILVSKTDDCPYCGATI